MAERLTVSAAVRLMPRPPALVLSKKTKMSVLQGRKDDGEGMRTKEAIIIFYSCALKASRCCFREEQGKEKAIASSGKKGSK